MSLLKSFAYGFKSFWNEDPDGVIIGIFALALIVFTACGGWWWVGDQLNNLGIWLGIHVDKLPMEEICKQLDCSKY